MSFGKKALLWCLFLVCVTGLFALAEDDAPAPAPGSCSADGRRTLTLLTDSGPRSMTMADWLPGALAAEMPASFEPEALKAQAVALRTFALAGPRHENADVCADAGCCAAWLDEPALRQRWGDDLAQNMRRVRDAVSATDGQILTYDGSPIQAAFHASSAGFTEASAAVWSPMPYLVSVPTPESADTVPGLVTAARFTPDELAQALDLDPAGDPAGWLGDIRLDEAGRVAEADICGRSFTGSALRARLGLRSTAFTVDWDGAAFVFTVSGYGHGVGMSQYGAQLYAAGGMSYADILAHYYPGTVLTDWAS